MKKVPKNLRWDSGQAVIIPVTLLLMAALSLMGRATGPAKVEAELTRSLTISKNAGALADAGSEDVTYRIKHALNYDGTEYVELDNQVATTTVLTSVTGNQKTVVALGDVSGRVRQKGISLIKGDQVDFNYAVQVGQGGFSMANSSSVTGNIYSNGPITGSGNIVSGSVVSAGPTGSIDNIHSGGNMYAHTIRNSFVGGSSYFQTISNTITALATYPGTIDKSTTSFPISDAQIGQWETAAAAGGTTPCVSTYTLSGTVTIGPKKINCNLSISNGAVVTFAGPVWAVGNITVGNSAVIKIDPALGSQSVAVIADNPMSRVLGSTININNSIFQNSGTTGSFFFFISANTSAESGGGVNAISISNSAQGPIVLYTNHGKIDIANSAQLRSVTGYIVSIKNSAQLIYEDGLESALFDTGPGGSWNVSSWKEVQ